MARGGGGNSAVRQHQRVNTTNSLFGPRGLLFILGFFAFFAIIYTVVASGLLFFSTPFGQKTIAVSVTIFAFIYTYTYPFWWVLGKIWDQIKCAALWLWIFVFYPIGNFIYWVFT
jgi:hypothetical protein